MAIITVRIVPNKMLSDISLLPARFLAMVVIVSVAVSKSSFTASSYLLSPSFQY